MKAERVFQKVCLISFYFLIIIMGQLWYFKSKNGVVGVVAGRKT
jgi:hypothetical protein